MHTVHRICDRSVCCRAWVCFFLPLDEGCGRAGGATAGAATLHCGPAYVYGLSLDASKSMSEVFMMEWGQQSIHAANDLDMSVSARQKCGWWETYYSGHVARSSLVWAMGRFCGSDETRNAAVLCEYSNGLFGVDKDYDLQSVRCFVLVGLMFVCVLLFYARSLGRVARQVSRESLRNRRLRKTCARN